MYEAFFGLRNRPFSPLPRVDTFIPLAPLREPLDTLVRCIDQQRGIGVLTAPAGAGKSLICRLLHHHFREMQRTVLLTTGRFPTRRALLQAVLFELKHPYVGLSEQEARLRVLDLLQASPAPLNRMLLIVDEAHLLSPRGLEELRTLTDYELNGRPCVSLVLSGQLELEELLTEPGMNALNQRVGCHVCIEPLTFEESSQYIRERLRFAGNDGLAVFTPEAVQLICSASEGSPRRLNQLCDHSLLLAFAEEECPVDESLVRSALLDLRELPLHWNAPLDLMPDAQRNPLEAFAAQHAALSAALPDEPLTECDTDLDFEDGSAFEDGNSMVAYEPDSSVFEIGGEAADSPIEQLFQVDKFIVPGEYRRASEPAAAPVVSTFSAPVESHTFETWPADLDETMNATPLVTSKTVQVMEFEELAVDDVYAVIDRQGEASQSARLPAELTPLQVTAPVKAEVVAATPMVVSVLNSPIEEDLDDTEFEEEQRLQGTPVDQNTAAPAIESQPVLMESQLLDFINEISVDVRQFREDVEGLRRASDGAASSGPPVAEIDRPRHQSLRQALHWQFDVVESEAVADHFSDAAAMSPETDRPSVIDNPPTKQFASSPSRSPEERASEEPGQFSPTDERRYAQLFTRLQRQRRRVESVMNQERRSGADNRSF